MAKRTTRVQKAKPTAKAVSSKKNVATKTTTPRVASPAGPLAMTTIHVRDFRGALKFYGETLGFKLGDTMDTPHVKWAEVHVGAIRLGIHAADSISEAGSRDPGGPTGIIFAPKDCDKAVEELRNRGVKIVVEPIDMPYGRHAEIADPEGNEYMLVGPARRP